MNREAIHSALFTLVSGVTSFAVKSRKLKHWGDMNAAEMPAIFQCHKYDVPTYLSNGVPPKWTMLFDLYIYVHSNQPGVAPSTIMNPILDALEAALTVTPTTPVQTLGGLVSHCRIGGGNMQTDEGVLGEIGVAIIPIEIVVP